MQLRFLPFRELAGAFRHALLMLMLFHFHLIFKRVDLALHKEFLLWKLLPFALGIIELELRFECVGRGLDRASCIDACDHIVLAYRLSFSDIKIR